MSGSAGSLRIIAITLSYGCRSLLFELLALDECVEELDDLPLLASPHTFDLLEPTPESAVLRAAWILVSLESQQRVGGYAKHLGGQHSRRARSPLFRRSSPLRGSRRSLAGGVSRVAAGAGPLRAAELRQPGVTLRREDTSADFGPDARFRPPAGDAPPEPPAVTPPAVSLLVPRWHAAGGARPPSRTPLQGGRLPAKTATRQRRANARPRFF